MIDELWQGGPAFHVPDGVFPLSTDSVMLAHFTNTVRAKNCFDLGCGAGIIAVLLALKTPALTVTGVELDEKSALSAVQNAGMNNLSERIKISNSDIRDCRTSFAAGAADLVVSNPPYYALGRGKKSAGGFSALRGEDTCSLADVCSAAGHLTRWGGAFALVHKPERLSEIFSELKKSGFEPKRMRFVLHKADASPSLVLIESRRGGNPSLSVEAPLILTDSSGGDSPEAALIYHR